MENVGFGLVEIVLVFGGVMGFGIWQIVTNRRALEKARAARAAETEKS